ncbi:MAG: hypothetical protein N2Z21_01030 [Candidatus Sumerlaeaceae bacterium]|nr:hypothetical protein [Candidatus Sumerlaeaceae bacterium]
MSHENRACDKRVGRLTTELGASIVAVSTAYGQTSAALTVRDPAMRALAEDIGKSPSTASLLSSGLTLILIVAAAVVIYALVRMSREMRKMRAAEEAQAARFEASILAAFSSANSSTMAATENSDDELPLPTVVSPVPNTNEDAQDYFAFEPLHQPVDVVSRRILSQLREAGLLQEIESHIPLHGNPKGAAILKLRNRKRVLLVPYYETEVFAERELTQYDAIIFLSRSGKGLFVQTLESVITEQFR